MSLIPRNARENPALPLKVLVEQAMPPQAAEHAKLHAIADNWSEVVGPQLARSSIPVDIAEDSLVVMVSSPMVASRLIMMGGNIARTLSARWQLKIKKVHTIVGSATPSPRSVPAAAPRPPVVSVPEEEVRALRRSIEDQAPDLPEEAVESLARLRAFFNRRFNRDRS